MCLIKVVWLISQHQNFWEFQHVFMLRIWLNSIVHDWQIFKHGYDWCIQVVYWFIAKDYDLSFAKIMTIIDFNITPHRTCRSVLLSNNPWYLLMRTSDPLRRNIILADRIHSKHCSSKFSWEFISILYIFMKNHHVMHESICL